MRNSKQATKKAETAKVEKQFNKPTGAEVSNYSTHTSAFTGVQLTAQEEIDIHLIYSNDTCENNGIHFGKLEEIKSYIQKNIDKNCNPSKIPCPRSECDLPIALALVCEHFRAYCNNFSYEHS